MNIGKEPKKPITLKRISLNATKVFALGAVINFAGPLFPYAEVISRSALAEAAATDGGGKARINLAEKLTVMSQSMAAAACIIDLGIDNEYEIHELEEAREEFSHMLHALEFGELALGVPTAEHYSKAIKAIRAVHEVWGPFEAAVSNVIAGIDTVKSIDLIVKTNGELLEKTELLVSALVAEHTNPNDTMLADAIAITFAERQVMLSQKLLLEACEIEGKYSSGDIIERFNQTISMFENSLIALRDGMPMVGINPPPNEEIKYQLDLAWEEWVAAKPVLAEIHANSDSVEEEILHVREVTEILDRRMHTIAIEYLLSTPGSEDIYKIPMLAYLNDTLLEWVEDPIILEAVRAANVEHASLTESQLETLEHDWEAEIVAGGGPLSDKIEHNAGSAFLRSRHEASSTIVNEIFVMDKHGLNVAESEVTPEYWHNKEDRFLQTIGDRSGNIHISEIHVEEGDHIFQSQLSVPIEDPDSGELIGVMTFGINIQSMF